MKFKTKITTGLLAIFATIVTVFALAWFNPGVKASTNPEEAGKANFWYKAYAADDYDFIMNFEDAFGVSYDKAVEVATTYQDRYDGYLDDNPGDTAGALQAAEDYWAGLEGVAENANVPVYSTATSSSAAQKAYKNYPEDWWWDLIPPCGTFAGGTFNFIDKTGSKYITDSTTVDPAKGKTITQIREAIQKYEEVIDGTDTFVAGSEFVILVYMSADNISNATLQIDYTFDGLVDAPSGITQLPAANVIDDDGIWNSSKFTGSIDTDVNTYKIGGYASSPVSGEFMIGGLRLTLKSSASGDHTIGFKRVYETLIDYDGNQVRGNAGNFTDLVAEDQQDFNIKSASSLQSVTAVADGKNYTGAETARGQTDATTSINYTLWTIDNIQSAESGTLNTTITYTAVAGRTIVKKSPLCNTITAALQALAGSGSSATDSHTITPSFTTAPDNKHNYTAIKLDNGDHYVIETVRNAYTDATLDDFSVTSLVGSTSTAVLFKQTDNPSVTTFSPSVKKYTISIPSDATGINIKIANTSLTYGKTAKINGTDAITTTGVVSKGSATTFPSFTIVVKAQDGDATESYTFTVKELSTIKTLDLIPDTATTTGITATYDSTSKTWKISGLKWADQLFKYTASVKNGSGTVITGAKIVVGTNTTNINNNKQTFNITTPTGATKFDKINFNNSQDIKLKVTSELGVATNDSTETETYTLTFERAAADTDVTIDTISAVTNVSGSSISFGALSDSTGNPSATGSYYFATADVPFAISNTKVTYYNLTVKATSKTTTVTIKDGGGNTVATGKGTATGKINFSTVTLQDPSTPVCQVVLTAENDNSPKTYEVKVKRLGGDNDATLSAWTIYGVEVVGGVDKVVYGYDALGNPVYTNGGYVTSFKDKYNFQLNSSSGSYILSNDASNTNYYVPTSIKKVMFNFTPKETTTSLTYNGGDIKSKDTKFPLTFSSTSNGPSTSNAIAAKTQAENTTNYYVTVYTNKISIDSYIKEIKVEGITDTSEIDQKNMVVPPSAATDVKYSYTMSTKNSQYKLYVTTNSSLSTIYWSKNQNDFNGGISGGSPVLPSAFKGTAFTNGDVFNVEAYGSSDFIYLYVVSEAEGTYATTYTIDVRHPDTRETKNNLTDVKIYAIRYDDKTSGVGDLIFSSFVKDTPSQTGSNPLQVDYAVTHLRFEVTLEGTKETVTGSVTTTNQTIPIHSIKSNADTKETYKVQGVAENTIAGTEYTFDIVRKVGRTGKVIVPTLNGNLADITDTNKFAFSLARGVLSPTLDFSSISDGAEFSISMPDGTPSTTVPATVSGLANGTYKIISVTVKSEADAVDKKAGTTYQIYVFNADKQNAIDNIEIKKDSSSTAADLLDVNNSSFVFNSGNVTPATNPFTIAYAANNPYFRVTNTTTPNSTISGDTGLQSVPQNVLGDESRTFKITSTSEFGVLLGNAGFTVPATEKITYQFDVTRKQASTVATLDKLKLDFTGSYTDADYPTFTDTEGIKNTIVTFENLTNTASVTFTYTKTDPKSVVTGIGTDPKNAGGTGAYVKQLTLSDGTKEQVTITVTAEDGITTNEYTFVLAYSKAEKDKIATASSITLTGNKTAADGDLLGFLPTQDYYPNIHISGKNDKALIRVTPDSNLASITIDGASYTKNTTYQYTGGGTSTALVQGQTYTIVIEITAQDINYHESYTIDLVVDSLSHEAGLSGVTEERYDSKTSTWSSPATVSGVTATGVCTIKVPNNITEFILNPTLKDSKATIVTNQADSSSPAQLQVGDNNLQIIVDAESGDAADRKTYKFNIIRDDVLDLEDIVINEKAGDPNLITYGDPTTYVFPVAYSVTSLNFEAQAVGSWDNLKKTLRAVTASKNIATTVVSQDDGTGNMIDVLTATLPLNVGKNEFKFTIETQSSDQAIFTFTITRAEGNSSNYIKTYVQEDNVQYAGKTANVLINGATVEVLDSNETITYVLPRSQAGTAFNPTITVTDGTVKDPSTSPLGYEITQTNRVLAAGRNTFTIKLLAENGDPRTYNVVVILADKENDINSMTVRDSDSKDYITYVVGKNSYEIEVPYSVNTLDVVLELSNAFSNVKVAGKSASSDGAGTYTAQLDTTASKSVNVVIENDYYQFSKDAADTKTIVLKITKGVANNDTRLKELTLSVGDFNEKLISFDDDGNIIYHAEITDKLRVSGNDFIVYNLDDAAINSFTFTATPVVAYPKTDISGGAYNSSKTKVSQNVPFDLSSYSQSHAIVVYNEAKDDFTTYTITVYRGAPVAAEKDNSIASLELFDSTGETYIDKSNYSESQQNYVLGSGDLKAISFGLNKSYTIVAGISAGSKAKAHIDNSDVTNKLFKITWPTEASTSSYAKAEAEGLDSYYSFTALTTQPTSSNYTQYYIYSAEVDKYISAKLLPAFDSSFTYYQRNVVSSSVVTSANYSSYYVTDIDYVAVHKVYATSDEGVDGKVYTIIVVAKAANVDATLSDLQVDGTTVSGFEPKVVKYDLSSNPYSNKTVSLPIYAKTTDESATLVMTNTATGETSSLNGVPFEFTINEGTNTFNITVTAEDGKTKKSYTLIIEKNRPAPTLKNLAIEGEKFYDSTLKIEKTYVAVEDETDPNFYDTTYYAKVGYNTSKVNFTLTLYDTDKNFTVKGSGNLNSDISSGVVRSFYALPSVGNNTYTFTITSQLGRSRSYTVIVVRSSKIDTSTEIDSVNVKLNPGDGYDDLLKEIYDPTTGEPHSIKNLGKDLLNANNGTIQFGPYLVPNKQTSFTKDDIDFVLASDVAGVEGATTSILNGDSLKVGDNTVIVKITSVDGSAVKTVLVDLVRAPYEYEITVDEIPSYDMEKEETYSVDAEVESLTFHVVDKNPSENKETSIKVLAGEPLEFGENTVLVQVTSYRLSDNGKSKVVDNVETKEVKVNRKDYDYTVLIQEISEFKDDYKANEVSSRVPYEVDADATTLNVEAFIEKDNDSVNLNHRLIINNKLTNALEFDTNEVTLIVELPDGKTEKEVHFKVHRPQYDLSIAGNEKEMLTANLVLTSTRGEKTTQLIASDEYGIKVEKSAQYLADVTVPSNVTKIGAELLTVPGLDDAKVNILTDGYLPIGTSVVEFEITSADGATTKHYSVLVTRNKMEFNVVTPDSLYELTKDNNRDGYYNLNLDTKPATIIADYLKAIEFDDKKNDLTVEVLSEVTAQTNEVILKVTNNQNPSEIEYVHLNIETTATQSGSLFDLLFWIILGISIILLIIILICVNRDKYGSVSKNRKRA